MLLKFPLTSDLPASQRLAGALACLDPGHERSPRGLTLGHHLPDPVLREGASRSSAPLLRYLFLTLPVEILD